jgi:lipopolysaccharide transport system ATP-binding protein
MSDIAIRAEGLSKLYWLGSRERYRTLRDSLTDALSAPFRRLRARETSNETEETFWALKDVSFEVKQGDVIGIIGRNGAGKSTLLKILSRITEPTKGQASIHGRIASLLEVGTGFHPELSGRDNIYLNGAILGMKKAEIRRKFDEIVAFAEVDKFIDTPVKHYSSGMYVRLAFAVAAHLEPEILVVDEVLAVGDVSFQKKCLGKMGEVSRVGRAVLFVSHNMAAIQQLTKSCLVLSDGRLSFVGKTAAAVDRYVASTEGVSSGVYKVGARLRPDVSLSRDVEFTHLWLPETCHGSFKAGQDIRIHTRLFARKQVFGFRLSFTVFRADGNPVGSGFSRSTHNIFAGEVQDLELAIEDHRLAPGRYHLGIATGTGDNRMGHVDFDVVLDVCHFEVLPMAGDQGTLSHWSSGWGSVRFEFVSSRISEQAECASSN